MPTYKKQETKRGRDKPWSGLDVHARISLPSLQHDPTAVKGDRTHECEETNSKAELQGTIANNKTQAQKAKKIQKLHTYISTCPATSDPFLPRRYVHTPYQNQNQNQNQEERKEKHPRINSNLDPSSPHHHRLPRRILFCFVSPSLPCPAHPSLLYLSPCDSRSSRIPKTNRKRKLNP